MSLSELVPESLSDETPEEVAGPTHEAKPIEPDGVASLLLRYEDLFDSMYDAFTILDYEELPSGEVLYVYRAAFDYEHGGEEYQIQIRRMTISDGDNMAANYWGYVVDIFSPVEEIDEHHRQYQCQRIDFSAEPHSTTSSIQARQVLEKDGVPVPDAYEAKYLEAAHEYLASLNHPDNPVDAEAFHQQVERDLFSIAWDLVDEQESFEQAIGKTNTLPPHITPAMQKQLEVFASFIEGFAYY